MLVQYDTTTSFTKEQLIGREKSMWRYTERLPLFDAANRVSLGEGMTPILKLNRLTKQYNLDKIWLKDEGLNPTGSFKSRGISMAVSKAKELGVKECVIPTAGNAGGALSAYCAAANIKATVIMPSHAPLVFQKECEAFGAKLILIDALIDKCGELASELEEQTGIFNLSTLKEPYRLEGKKTMGYEIAEQMNWQLPDVIIYPTGGGTGLVGIWKAFHEMIDLGWINGSKLPKMVAVQTSGCAPIVNILSREKPDNREIKSSIAPGLVVPKAFGEDMIVQVINESNGYAISVTDEQILQGVKEICRQEGILISPEGAATWVALKNLAGQGKISSQEKVLLLNTGSGLKSLDIYG